MSSQPLLNRKGQELTICFCTECKGLRALRPRTVAKHLHENGRWQDPNVQEPTLAEYLGPVASTSSGPARETLGDKRLGDLEALEVAETRSPKRSRTGLELPGSHPDTAADPQNVGATDAPPAEPPQLGIGQPLEGVTDAPIHGQANTQNDGAAADAALLDTLGLRGLSIDGFGVRDGDHRDENQTGAGEQGIAMHGGAPDEDGSRLREQGTGMQEDGGGDSDVEMRDEEPVQQREGEEDRIERPITQEEARAIQTLAAEEDMEPAPFDGFEDVSMPAAKLDNIKIAQEFVEDIQCATLENDGLSEETIRRLRKAEPAPPLTPEEKFNFEFYLALADAPERIFNDTRNVVNSSCGTSIPTHFVLKRKMEDITGITAIEDDMCINGCHAFTGPRWGQLEKCSVCSEDRYEPSVFEKTGKKVPRKRMTTIPLGMQIQALRRSAAGADAMGYRDQKTKEILAFLGEHGFEKLDRDDIFCGRDYLRLAEQMELTEDDVVVNFSMDGAQLYQNKKSDTWIAIWVVQDYDPKERFKKKYMLPAMIIPGPHKPKNLDSYTYRSMHHLSAIQREDSGRGIKCWDGRKRCEISTRVVCLLKNADAVGLTDIDGRVGHHGVRGCRVGCDMPGRNKPEQGHYYAVHLQPVGYTVADSNHPDIDIRSITSPTVEEYNIALALVERSATRTAYEENRKKTGISKRSIVSGLVKKYTLPPPKCFTVDLMHAFWINAGDLKISLWRGKMKCEPTDDIRTWDWAVFRDVNTWNRFGQLVADATPHFPSSFHRPPRNPALKINSKYKATEYFLLLFGLGPGLLRSFLPREYWRHFCKLARAVRILTLRKITVPQLRDARVHMVQYVEEYEQMYYQRRPDRIHFCRPLLHTFLHIPLEADRVGPGTYSTQFENERAIGDFGKQIRQPSNPFGNLARIAVRSAQKSALKTTYPELQPIKPLPRGAYPFPNDYTLLTPKTKEHRIKGTEGQALLRAIGTDVVQKYGKAKLPNGQILRSVYAESSLIKRAPRISLNARIFIGAEGEEDDMDSEGKYELAKIQFFFLQTVATDPVTHKKTKVPKALISVYGPRVEEIWEDSYKTVWACTMPGDDLRVVDISQIKSCVSMQPLESMPGDPENMWQLVEKSGIEEIELSGYADVLQDHDDE